MEVIVRNTNINESILAFAQVVDDIFEKNKVNPTYFQTIYQSILTRIRTVKIQEIINLSENLMKYEKFMIVIKNIIKIDTAAKRLSKKDSLLEAIIRRILDVIVNENDVEKAEKQLYQNYFPVDGQNEEINKFFMNYILFSIKIKRRIPTFIDQAVKWEVNEELISIFLQLISTITESDPTIIQYCSNDILNVILVMKRKTNLYNGQIVKMFLLFYNLKPDMWKKMSEDVFHHLFQFKNKELKKNLTEFLQLSIENGKLIEFGRSFCKFHHIELTSEDVKIINELIEETFSKQDNGTLMEVIQFLLEHSDNIRSTRNEIFFWNILNFAWSYIRISVTTMDANEQTTQLRKYYEATEKLINEKGNKSIESMKLKKNLRMFDFQMNGSKTLKNLFDNNDDFSKLKKMAKKIVKSSNYTDITKTGIIDGNVDDLYRLYSYRNFRIVIEKLFYEIFNEKKICEFNKFAKSFKGDNRERNMKFCFLGMKILESGWKEINNNFKIFLQKIGGHILLNLEGFQEEYMLRTMETINIGVVNEIFEEKIDIPIIGRLINLTKRIPFLTDDIKRTENLYKKISEINQKNIEMKEMKKVFGTSDNFFNELPLFITNVENLKLFKDDIMVYMKKLKDNELPNHIFYSNTIRRNLSKLIHQLYNSRIDEQFQLQLADDWEVVCKNELQNLLKLEPKFVQPFLKCQFRSLSAVSKEKDENDEKIIKLQMFFCHYQNMEVPLNTEFNNCLNRLDGLGEIMDIILSGLILNNHQKQWEYLNCSCNLIKEVFIERLGENIVKLNDLPLNWLNENDLNNSDQYERLYLLVAIWSSIVMRKNNLVNFDKVIGVVRQCLKILTISFPSNTFVQTNTGSLNMNICDEFSENERCQLLYYFTVCQLMELFQFSYLNEQKMNNFFVEKIELNFIPLILYDLGKNKNKRSRKDMFHYGMKCVNIFLQSIRSVLWRRIKMMMKNEQLEAYVPIVSVMKVISDTLILCNRFPVIQSSIDVLRTSFKVIELFVERKDEVKDSCIFLLIVIVSMKRTKSNRQTGTIIEQNERMFQHWIESIFKILLRSCDDNSIQSMFARQLDEEAKLRFKLLFSKLENNENKRIISNLS
ncbi:hypothetical protein SNEBB_002229 [Seison nebaliae]|nr:hypothetical protein SNEBB_002229 [Seison nebaliae]